MHVSFIPFRHAWLRVSMPKGEAFSIFLASALHRRRRPGWFVYEKISGDVIKRKNEEKTTSFFSKGGKNEARLSKLKQHCALSRASSSLPLRSALAVIVYSASNLSSDGQNIARDCSYKDFCGRKIHCFGAARLQCYIWLC